jgi:hypothetical protein
MHRTDADGNASNLFTDGNAGTGTPATVIDDDWLNAVQEEIANAVEGNGTTLVKGTYTQLRDTLTALLQAAVQPGGRLTLTTATPVTTSDVTGATTVYYTPCKGTKIPLYDGTRWRIHTFAEMSQLTTDATKSPAAVSANAVYDVFVWLDGSTLRATRGPAWTSDTARGTGAGSAELELFEGRHVNKVAITNGPAARRGLYVGTIRSDSSSQINDSIAKRHVWNTYNRVRRSMQALDATATWNYSTASFRQANAASTNQIDFVLGLSEDSVTARASGSMSNSTATARSGYVGIGLDSTTVNSAGLSPLFQGGGGGPSMGVAASFAFYESIPSIGRHYLAWLEKGDGTDTQIWRGASINGIIGMVMGVTDNASN